MGSSTVELTATARPRVGKGAARQTRREGKLPAVIYGNNKEPEAIALNANEVWKQYLKGGFTSTVFKIQIDGTDRMVVARDMQLHPVRDTPLHVDFMRISDDGRIRVKVPVRFINEASSPGMKRGGALNIVRHDIEVWCPYDKIPPAFTIDLATATIGTSIHVSELDIPDDVSPTIQDRDFTVATITGRMAKEEVLEDAPDADAEGGSEGDDEKKE
ncbi:MAG: 50S ribosomal protein L25/general stress protein Ctc [Pseudomonadota bacterium]